MIKKPISPNFDHSNRFLTDYILQNFAFTYAYVAILGAKKSVPGHTLFLLLNIILKSFTMTGLGYKKNSDQEVY